MIYVIRIIYLFGASLCLLAAILVTSSLYITDRAPQSNQFLTVSIVVSIIFFSVGFLMFGIQLYLTRAMASFQSLEGMVSDALGKSLSRLAGCLILAGVLLCASLALVNYAILARINQGFAVFG